MKWAQDLNGPNIYWLCGMAGTGKTTIARSFCERLEDEGILAASFFCSRTADDTRDIKAVLPTIAREFATRFLILPSELLRAVEADRKIASCQLDKQYTDLILNLVKGRAEDGSFRRPRIVVLDAFDAFKTIDDARDLLTTITKFAPESPNIRFFITSRSDPQLEKVLKPVGAAFYLHDVEQSMVRRDIELYLQERRDHIRMENGLPDTWMTDDELKTLSDNARKSFVYASTACSFLENSNAGEFEGNLKLVLNSDSHHKTSESTLAQYSQLDGLYSQVLKTAKQDPRWNSIYKVLIVVITALNPLPSSTIACLLNIDHEAVRAALESLGAVITIPNKMDIPVLPFHASFPDFLHDDSRSKEYHIREVDAHHAMLRQCLDVLDSSPALKQNICNINKNDVHISTISPSPLETIPQELQYSAIYWLVHLDYILNFKDLMEPEAMQVLNFFDTHILHWIECMALLGRLGDSVHLLRQIELSQEVSLCKVHRVLLLTMHRPVQSFPLLQWTLGEL
jgi:hypothetical protein